MEPEEVFTILKGFYMCKKLEILDTVFSSSNEKFNEANYNLLKQFSERKLKAKQAIVAAGEKWNEVIYIQKGLVRIFYRDPEGREFNKSFYVENQLLCPLLSIVRHQMCTFNISTVEDCTLYLCPFDRFKKHLIEIDYWETFALPYIEGIAEQKYYREYDFLMLSATERLLKFFQNYPMLNDRIPEYHLASYLGITNVSLSRIRKTLSQSDRLENCAS